MRVAMLAACLLVAACKADVYTGLSERDANEMLSVLLTNGVDAQKQVNGDQGVTLSVDQSDLARAIELLSAGGLPRDQQESIGKVFAKNGIMSSPFEERVRYLYALGEEISKTLMAIDGVTVARVHVVLPEKADLGTQAPPPSAAVFIKYQRAVDLDFLVPQIRRLVSKAIEGVSYENVTVVLDEAAAPAAAPAATTETLLGIGISASDGPLFWKGFIALAAVSCLLVLSNGFFAFKYLRRYLGRSRRRSEGDLASEDGA